MIEAPRWTKEQLEKDLETAISLFREERTQESIEEYTVVFDQFQGTVEDLLETSVDLSQLDETLIDILTNPKLLEAFRYLAGPPISKDDLMVVAKAQLSPARLKENPEMAARVLGVVRMALDQRRFPWVIDEREPTPAEKNAAVIASAALLATSRVGTNRRSVGKEKQEVTVQEALLKRGLTQVPTRQVLTSLHSAPKEGEFCRESLFGSSKADFLVGLWDKRIMAIECKVSNSSTNSVKRLNREAAGKAEKWLHEFGALNVVPVAVLSGVYKIRNLISAQSRGLTLYWAHDLDQLLDWIETGKP
jgi:hypothetical protein